MFGEQQVLNKPTLADDIRSLRSRLHSIMGAVSGSKGGRNEALVFACLERARMMLGNTLGEINCPNPYHGAEQQRLFGNSTHIPEEVDTADRFHLGVELTKVQRVDLLRKEIEECYVTAKELYLRLVHQIDPFENLAFLMMEDAVKSVKLAKNYFGKELGRLRDETVKSES